MVRPFQVKELSYLRGFLEPLLCKCSWAFNWAVFPTCIWPPSQSISLAAALQNGTCRTEGGEQSRRTGQRGQLQRRPVDSHCILPGAHACSPKLHPPTNHLCCGGSWAHLPWRSA